MVDVLEFYSSNNALYLFDIAGSNNRALLNDATLSKVLPPIVEKYGLISYQAAKIRRDGSCFYIACYYSRHALLTAKKELPASLEWHGIKCSVKCYTDERGERRPLLYHQCCDLINYYIGFNNWAIEVKSKKLDITGTTLTSTCTVSLHIPRFLISTEGSASHTMKGATLSKGTKAGIALKMAFVKACSQAFATLVLAVAESGKCCVVLVDSVEEVKLDIQVTEVETDLDAELEFDEFIDMLLEHQAEDLLPASPSPQPLTNLSLSNLE